MKTAAEILMLSLLTIMPSISLSRHRLSQSEALISATVNSVDDTLRKSTRGPILLERREPKYPDSALKDSIEGEVWVEMTVDKEGAVRVAYCSPGTMMKDLEKAAIEATLRWKFQPALLDGNPIESRVTIPIRFRLSRSSGRTKQAHKEILIIYVRSVRSSNEDEFDVTMIEDIPGSNDSSDRAFTTQHIHGMIKFHTFGDLQYMIIRKKSKDAVLQVEAVSEEGGSVSTLLPKEARLAVVRVQNSTYRPKLTTDKASNNALPQIFIEIF